MPSDSYVPTHNNKNILHKHFFLSHLKTTIQISRSWLIFISIPLKQRWDPKKTSYLFSSSTAAIAKSFQSCSTLYDPRECSPPSLGFSRQEHWSGLSFPSPMHENEKWKWSRSVVSDPQRPQGLQPTRLLHPWEFPGKSTGVGCHFLLSSSSIYKKCFTFSLQK